MLMLADVLNDKRVTMLKNVFMMYNDDARLSASGQMDIFSGGVPSREEILKNVIKRYSDANKKQIEAARRAAVERRKTESTEQVGTPPKSGGTGGQGNTPAAEQGGRGDTEDTTGQQPRDLAQTENLNYKLSDEVDENGHQFVLNSDGNIEFGRIDEETGLTPAPILLSEGVITNPNTNAGYGLLHIEARHGEQIRAAGYGSVLEFIEEVAKNYEVIRKGNDRDGRETYMLQLTDKHNNTLMVELSGDGTYWNINTAGIFKISYGANRTVVYNRHTTANQPAETDEASLSGEQSGTTPLTRMNTPAQTADISAGKGSGKTANDQGKGENVAEGEESVATGAEDTGDQGKPGEKEDKLSAAEKQVRELLNPYKESLRKWRADGDPESLHSLVKSGSKIKDFAMSLDPDVLEGLVAKGVFDDLDGDEKNEIEDLPGVRKLKTHAFEETIRKQGKIEGQAKPAKKTDPFKFVLKGKEVQVRPTMAGKCYTNGYEVCTDGYVLIAVKSDYPKEKEGIVEDKKGNRIEGKYPHVMTIVKSVKEKSGRSVKIDVQDMRNFLQGVLDKAGKKGTAVVSLRMPDGMIIGVEAKNAKLVLDAMDYYGIDTLNYSYETKSMLAANDKASLLITPVFFGDGYRNIEDTYCYDLKKGEEDKRANFHKAESDNSKKEAGAPVTEEEAALRDGLNELLREAGMPVIDDVEEGQRVLDMVNGEAKLMGSRTNKKMANIGEALEGRELTEQQQKVVDVFRGKSDNTPIEVERADGKVRVIMRQGNDEKSGTKHSLYGHYGTNKGVITDEDILIIPDVLARGERTPKMRGNTQLYEYTLNGENGTRYTVLTEKKHSREEFADFYTNKKTSQSARKTRSEEARDIDNYDVSSAKVEEKSKAANKSGEKLREHRVYHGSGADFDAFDHSHMGEGEGAQAHGWGTYVTKSEDVGRGYAEEYDTQVHLSLDGEETTGDEIESSIRNNIPLADDFFDEIYKFGSYYDKSFAERLDESGVSIDELKEELEDSLSRMKDTYPEEDYSQYDEVLQQIEDELDSVEKDEEDSQPTLYTVDIPDDTGDNYIEEEQTLQELNRPDMAGRIDKVVDDYLGAKDFFNSWQMPGWQIRNEIVRFVMANHSEMSRGEAERKCSELLSKAGVVGMHYYGSEDGECYVIFNDKDLKITDKVRFFRTADGEAYGFTVGGKIYIDPRIATSETSIHEYTHLWAEALRKANPKEWQNVVKLMKGTWAWDYVKRRYPELKTDDEIAEESLAHFSGRRGAVRLREVAREEADKAKGVMDKAAIWSAFAKIKDALGKFWKHIAEDILHIHFTSAEEVADKVMYDLLNGFNPNTFNLSKSVEEGKDLIAAHNLTEDKLKQSLELGGFPMPSIAITKTSMGHVDYGDISLLFGKDTINPSDRRNKVYGGDAWTPTFPPISYKLNEKKTGDIYSRANKAGNLPLFKSVELHPENLSDRIDGKDPAEIIESFKEDYGMKQMFLSEKGNPVKEYVKKTVDKYSPDRVGLLQQILDKIGVEGLKSGKYDNELKQMVGSHFHVDLDGVAPFRAKIMMQRASDNAIDFSENGNKKVENDVEATEKEIDSRIDPKEYDQWLHDMFDGIIEKKGIRNNTDPYTRSGNRRKWERLYDAVTLDNVLKAMKAQPAKSGGFFGTIFGASAKELSNLNEVREEAKRRIKSVPEEEFKVEKDKILSRLEKISLPSVKSSNSISVAMDFVGNVKDAVVHSHTPKGIFKYLSDIYPDMTMDVANEIADVVKDIQSMSANYLEAKPYRAVGFDEVKAAVVPSDTDTKIVQQLKDKGIPVYTYEKGNAEERRQVVNDAAREQRVKFHKAEYGDTPMGNESARKSNDDALFRLGDGNETFAKRQRRAVENKGTVAPGLNSAEVKVVDVPKHDFTGTGKQAIDKARVWAEQNLVGLHTAHRDDGNTYDYQIDDEAVGKYLSSSSTLNSDNLGVHLAVLKKLPEVIDNSIEAEEHPDYKKVKGERSADNGVADANLLVHRMYGAVNIDGNIYRVKTTMHEHLSKGNAPHDYRVTKVELLISGSATSNALSNSTGSHSPSTVTAAKLLQNVEKAYDKGKLLLDEAKNPSEVDYRGRMRTAFSVQVKDDYEARIDQQRKELEGRTIPANWLFSDEHNPLTNALGRIPRLDAEHPLHREEDGVHSERVPREVTLNDYYSSTAATFRPVDADWEAMRKSGRYQYAHSPYSSSEYLVDTESGNVYRRSDHWGKVASCRWNLEGREEGTTQIGVANIKDFEPIAPRQYNYLISPEAVTRARHQLYVYNRLLNDENMNLSPKLRKGLEARMGELEAELNTLESRVSSEGDIINREGNGPASDDDISFGNDLIGQVLGKQWRKPAQRSAFAARERERMKERADELSKKLHLDGIEILDEAPKGVTGRQRKAKGWYNTKTGRITIVLGNHTSARDVENTILHEGVAHHGLRQLFGKHFADFLRDVYRSADENVRKAIAKLATGKYHGNFETATEEYLGSMAEEMNFESVPKMLWIRIRHLFEKMLRAIGLKSKGRMSDNELRYILWKSYKNLKAGGKSGSILDEAEDVAKQYELKVGDYAEDTHPNDDAADTEVMRRKTGFGEMKFSDGKREQQTANERFNNELTRYQNGEMDKNEMLHLGRPQGVMRAFLPNLPIVMRQRILTKGSVKKHNVAVEALVDMPNHLSHPIFVFKRSDNVLGVLTEMQDRDGKNVCVAIELSRQIQNGGEILEVNDIRSVHGREISDIVYPILKNGTLKWVDKKKGLSYLSSASRYVQQEIDKQDLSSAAKIVEDFVNPKVPDENVADEGIMFRDGDMGLEETITKMKVEASQANADNWQAKQDAMRAIGGNLNKLRLECTILAALILEPFW